MQIKINYMVFFLLLSKIQTNNDCYNYKQPIGTYEKFLQATLNSIPFKSPTNLLGILWNFFQMLLSFLFYIIIIFLILVQKNSSLNAIFLNIKCVMFLMIAFNYCYDFFFFNFFKKHNFSQWSILIVYTKLFIFFEYLFCRMICIFIT